MAHPGTKAVIIRRVYKDVKENHIDKYLEEYPILREYYSISNETITIPTSGAPSPILFRYAENLESVKRQFMGPEYYDIFLDQAEQFSEQELRIIKTTNRAPNRKQGECKMALFFNPGGIGTEYLRRIFWQKRFEGSERSCDYQFIQAYGWDNYVWFDGLGYSEKEFYALSSDERFELFITKTQYGRDLNALPKALRAGHLLGNFESFEGQYYAGVWDESRQILTDRQVDDLLQPWWTCWIAIDWGFAHHACALWFASGKVNPARFKAVFGVEVSHEIEVVVCYRELVVSETEEQDLAGQIVDNTPSSERKLIKSIFLSPDAWQKRGSANAIADTMSDVFRKGSLPMAYPAQDERIGGWRLLYSLFRSSHDAYEKDYEQHNELLTPMLFISPLCCNVMEAVPLAMRDDKHPGRLEDVLKTPTKADDVLDCFAGNTQVYCEYGPKRIDQVQPGDMVWTRAGLRPVVQQWKVRKNARIVRATFSDGTQIQCTPEHRFLTQRGFVPIDTLRYDDILMSWTALNSMAGSIQETKQDTTALADVSITATCGQASTDQYHQSITSTIEMKTEKTTQSRIWSASPEQSISATTTKGNAQTRCEQILIESEPWHLSGTEPMQEGRGIVPTQRAGLFRELIGYAKYAVRVIQGFIGKDSAPMPANLASAAPHFWTTSFANALSAVLSSASIDIQGKGLAVGYAVRLLRLENCGFEDVYDLEIEGKHEFFANGILAHNCLRYGVASMLSPKVSAPISVQAKELWDRLPAENPEQVQGRAMAMLKFEHDARKTKRRATWAH
jgi:hypothetical protein